MFGLSISHRGSRLFARGGWLLVAAASVCVGGTFDRPACGATLQQLFAGASLQAGDTGFSDWQLISVDSTLGVTPDFSQITVVPVTNDPANPGLAFSGNGQLSVSGINAVDLLFKFRVHALAGGNSFAGHTLSLTGVSFGSEGGIAYISNDVTSHVGADLGPTVVIADNESDVTQFVDTSSFAPQAIVDVVTNVFLTTLSGADVITLTSFTQRFAQTGPPALSGDYNGDGAVDAADYVVWRRIDGSNVGYTIWRTNFGQSISGGGATLRAVPEPSTMWPAALAVCALPAIATKRSCGRPRK